MKNENISAGKKVAIAAVGAASATVAAAAGVAAVDFVQNGLSESASIRVAEANVCAPGQNGEASFAGCSSII
jgi:hypothetical protein